MKKKLLTPIITFMVVLILTVGLSFAQSTREATFGGKNSNNVFRLMATRDNNGAYISVSPTGVGWNPGYEVFSTSAATNNLDATDSGRRLIDNSTYGGRFVLPQAVAGLEIELCTGAQNFVTLDTNNTNDTIHHTISGTALDAGDALLSSGESGDCVRVTAGSANNWYITGMGPNAWSDHGTN